MKATHLVLLSIIAVVSGVAFTNAPPSDPYRALYDARIAQFASAQQQLLRTIAISDVGTAAGREAVMNDLVQARTAMKAADLWLRYLGPLLYKRINGPLPVEWETEVFEKYERPYKRIGAGLTLAELYLGGTAVAKDSLMGLVQASILATDSFTLPPITNDLATPDHFLLADRLFLLDLAAIYTTGFECPDPARVVPELRRMMHDVAAAQEAYNARFPDAALPEAYLQHFTEAIAFVDAQPDEQARFDHFTFIQRYVDPLFAGMQQAIADHHVRSHSYMDYALGREARSLFAKDLYQGQEAKGIFRRVDDPAALAEIERVGRLLFFDPLLSGNNARSCASCHRPTCYFTDTLATAPQFDRRGPLARNTPSLIDAGFNHLLMADGRHTTLQEQAEAVIASPTEMGGNTADALRKVMSCPDYRRAFQHLLRTTPQMHEVTIAHVVSAITFYYARFSTYRAPFDEAMDRGAPLDTAARRGFNLFMSKAQCGTCHFVPVFNGVKPPFIGSEFEVLGVPEDRAYAALSDDLGRFGVNPAPETRGAFRTGSLRNVEHTAPYMHNGVFATLTEVIDFYDTGGGAGHGLAVPGQTLASGPLDLSAAEKAGLLAFLHALNERIVPDTVPPALPRSADRTLAHRISGGTY